MKSESLSRRLQAQPHWRRIALASDLHLGEQAPRTTAAFLRWLRSLGGRADALLLLGDVFDAWIGDDLLRRPEAALEHQACEALAELAARHCRIAVQRGNRDFLLAGEFASRCAACLLDDPCVLEVGGQRIVLSHGDALCVDDAAYMQWRRVCREPAWQADFLAQPLALRRQQALAARDQSRAAQAALAEPGDASPAEAMRVLSEQAAAWMIHGHTHRPREHWQGGRLRQVLGDWDLDHPERQRAQALWLLPGDGWVEVQREDLLAQLQAAPAAT